jgi:hypothetical protein
LIHELGLLLKMSWCNKTSVAAKMKP